MNRKLECSRMDTHQYLPKGGGFFEASHIPVSLPFLIKSLHAHKIFQNYILYPKFLKNYKITLKLLGAVWIHFFGHLISITHHSSLITHNLSLITLKYHVCLAPSLTSHHSIFFTLFVGPITITGATFFLIFFNFFF